MSGEIDRETSGMGVIHYKFGRDRLSTNVRFASIPTVNSGALGFVAMCQYPTFHSAFGRAFG